MALPKKLINKLEDFLYKRSESDGGYAKVQERDLEKLGEIVSLIVQAKYEKDPDGDIPVSFDLYDRTKYVRPYFSPIPHLHNADGDVEILMSALRSATGNMETAQEQVRNITRQLEHSLDERMGQGNPVVYGGKKYEMYLPHVNSRQELVDKLCVELNKNMASHPPQDEEIEDYTSKQKWEHAAGRALSKKLGTQVSVSCYPYRRGEDGKVRVVARLTGLAYGEQEEALGAQVKVEPEKARPAGKKPSP